MKVPVGNFGGIVTKTTEHTKSNCIDLFLGETVTVFLESVVAQSRFAVCTHISILIQFILGIKFNYDFQFLLRIELNCDFCLRLIDECITMSLLGVKTSYQEYLGILRHL